MWYKQTQENLKSNNSSYFIFYFFDFIFTRFSGSWSSMSPLSSKKKYKVFEFSEEDELVEKTAKKMLGKYSNPSKNQRHSSPIDKYKFLQFCESHLFLSLSLCFFFWFKFSISWYLALGLFGFWGKHVGKIWILIFMSVIVLVLTFVSYENIILNWSLSLSLLVWLKNGGNLNISKLLCLVNGKTYVNNRKFLKLGFRIWKENLKEIMMDSAEAKAIHDCLNVVFSF